MSVTLTNEAISKVRELLSSEGEPGMALRIGVKSGGCSGFRYEMYFDTETLDTDVLVEFDGVPVVMDAASAPLLEGATLEYKSSLTESGFKVQNPQAKRTCGCGQSFS
jgi:iron-sulfur cluster assembly protein/iron-sulfur cluster insertion protein